MPIDKYKILEEIARRGDLTPEQERIYGEFASRGLVKPRTNPPPTGEIKRDYPVRRAISNIYRPTLEGTALGVGGVVGAPLGPAGSAVGAGTLYSAAGGLADRFDEFLELVEKEGLWEPYTKAVERFGEGALLEAGGQSVVGGAKLLSKGVLALAEKTHVAPLFRKIKELFPSMSDQGILKKARDTLQDMRVLDPTGKAKLKESEKLLKRAGITAKPTFAQKTGSIRAGMAEQSMTAKDRELSEFLKRQDAQINQQARQNIARKFPGKEGPADVIKAVEGQQKKLTTKAQQATQQAENKIVPLQAGRNTQESGKLIKSKLEENKKMVKENIDELYNAIPTDTTIPSKPLQKSLGKLSQDFRKVGGGPSSVPIPIIKQMRAGIKEGAEKGTLTFNQLRDYRSQISQELRDIYRSNNPNLKLARRLKMLENGVDETMDQMLKLAPEDAEVMELYRLASSEYKNYVKVFRQGTVGDVLQPGKRGSGGKVDFDSIPSRFFRTGKMDAADDLKNAVGPQNATALIDDYAGFDLLSKAYRNGELNAKVGEQWLANNKTVLDKYGLTKKFTDIVKTKSVADKRLAELEAYNKTVASRIIGFDLDDVMKNLFGGKSRMQSATRAKELLNMPGVKGNKSAEEGVRNAFKDFMLKEWENTGVDVLTNPLMSIAKSKKFLDQFRPAMKVLYKDSPEKVKALYDYHSLLRLIARNKNISYAGGSTTIEKADVGFKKDLATNVAQYIAVTKGAGWKFSVLKNMWNTLVGGPARYSREQVNKLLTEAMYNPEVAKTIMEAGFYKHKKTARKKIAAHMITVSGYSAKKFLEEQQ